MTNVIVTQEVNETLGLASPNIRTSQEVIEALAAASPNALASQLVVETLSSDDPSIRVSQLIDEVLSSTNPFARASQLVIEVLVVNWNRPMPPLYPTLPGLTFDVDWSPEFFNMPTDTTQTGADIDLNLSALPLHNFDLVYSTLRNGYFNDPLTYGGTEWKTFAGFWLSLLGTSGRFLFDWPDDDTVTGQLIGTTDGATSTWTIQRTFGVTDYNSTEPVGYIDNVTYPVTVYLDGVAQLISTYSIESGTPVNQQLKFTGTPAGGQVITMDIPKFYYYCKFPDNKMTFKKFMSTIWEVNKVSIHSCRVNA